MAAQPEHEPRSNVERESGQMNASTMWKAPTRREYKPKPMDPGQRVTWTHKTDGYWTVKPTYDGGVFTEGSGWVETVTSQRSGEIWSEGSSPNTWWVLPDDDQLNPVIVRRAGKKHRMEYGEGVLFQSNEGSGWRNAVRRAENVRARGIYPVVESTEAGRYDYTYRKPRRGTHTVVWHADPECPDAAGKARYDGEGYARNYHHDSGVWTAYDVACVLMGLEQIGCSPTPFCARCVMLDTSLASQHSCASVSA